MRSSFLLVAVLALAACSAREETGDDDLDFDATDWNANLDARAGSGIEGTADVRSAGLSGAAGTTIADVSITGAAPGAQHPWHVHAGTCESGGPIMGDPDEYPVLTVNPTGAASATAELGIGLSESARYHVNVHRSPNDLGTIVACGDLRD